MVVFAWACLLAQACLLLFRLDLLPVWGDEQFTLDVCLGPFTEIVPRVAVDSHPPGYYMLMWAWLRLFPAAGPRLFSALVMLAATAALWLLFLRRMTDRAAARWILLLWVLSPFVVLYGRMGRSYSLQLLAVLVAARAAEKAFESGRFLWVSVFTAVALYVHYVPGFCLAAVVIGRLVWERRWRDAARHLGIIAMLYAPWIAVALSSASRELVKHVYFVFQGQLAEHPLRIAYTWIAWHFGETLPLPVIVAAAPVAAFWTFAAWRGASQWRGHGLALAGAAACGYLIISRVVIFSLVPARLLFLMPFYMILAGSARMRYRRAAGVAAVAMLAFDGWALANYFGKTNFLNKGYLVPFDEIASRFAGAGPGTVLVDVNSVDTRPLWPRIPPRLRARIAAGPGEFDPGDAVVFHVRGPRDLSAGKWNDRIDAELRQSRSCTVEGFTPYDRYDQWLMGLLGWPEKPTHMLQLVTCRL